MVEDKPNQFSVILLGIVFDPESRKILIGRRENDPHIERLTNVFPGGKAEHKEDLQETLKKRIKEETGYEVASLGSISSRIPDERNDFVLIYYLCEVTGGEMKAGEPLKEVKWVNPEELENEFSTSFDPALKEYINNLKSSISE